MSQVRARYSGNATIGVDVTVELDTGEFRSIHVAQGGLLPADIDGTPVSAAFRDRLLEQDDWTRQRQTSQTTDEKKEG